MYLRYHCPPDLILYNRETRDTHCLAAPASQILQLIESSNEDLTKDVELLRGRYTSAFGVPVDDDQLQQSLDHLKGLALIP